MGRSWKKGWETDQKKNEETEWTIFNQTEILAFLKFFAIF